MPRPTVEEIIAMQERAGVFDRPAQQQQPPTTPRPSKPSASPGFLGTLGDMTKGVGEGAIKSVEETAQFGFDIVNWFDDLDGKDDIADHDFDLVPDSLKTQTAAGGLVSGITRFATGFLGAGKFLKMAKLGGVLSKLGKAKKYIEPMLKGAVVDAVVFDPHEERLSNLFTMFPVLENPITNYLAADPNDTKAEGRLKNVLEGLALGSITEGVFTLVKGLKSVKAAASETEVIDAVIKTADNVDTAFAKGAAATAQPQAVAKAPQTASERLLAAGIEPTDDLIKAERLEAAKNTIPGGFDIELDGDALHQQFDIRFNRKRPIDPPPVGRGYQRTDMLNTKNIATEDGKNLVQAVSDYTRPVVSKETIDPRTWAEAEKNVDAFLRRAYSDTPAKAFFQRLTHTADVVEKVDETLILGKIAIDDGAVKIRNLQNALSATKDEAVFEGLEKRLHNIVQKVLVISDDMERIATGLGRGMNMLKNTGTKAHDLSAIWDESTKVIGKASRHERLAIYGRLAAAAAEDPAELARMLRVNPTSGRFWALHNELWINGLLSGPTTQFVNAVSSALKFAVFMPLDKMAGGWGGFKGGVFSIADRELFDEGLHAWRALATQFHDSVQMASRAFSVGENILKTHNTIEYSTAKAWRAETFGADPTKWTGKAINTFGKMLNLPTRFLLTTDEFTSQIVYRSKLQLQLEQAAKRAVAEGRIIADPQVIARYINENFNLAFLPTTLSDGTTLAQGAGIAKDALREAAEANFATQLRKGSISGDISAILRNHPALQPIMPFIRTPVNILRDVGIHTPFLGRRMAEFKEAMAQGGKAAAMAEGRLRVGGLLWASGISLAMTGNITGGGPKNPVQREALLATGWRPYSLRVGDTYVNYSRLDPFGMFLGICADWSEIATNNGNEDLMSTATAMLMALPKNLASKTYLKGLSDALAAVSDPEKNASWVLKQRALSYIPAFLSQTRRIIDPEMHEVEGMLDSIKDRLPGFSRTLPTQYSWLTGKPVRYHGGMFSGISPIVFSVSDKERETIGTELSRHSQAFTQPPKVYKGVQFTPEQTSEFHRLHGTVEIGGKTLEQALVALFDSPQYDRHGAQFSLDEDPISGRRAALIRNVVERYRARAFQELHAANPEIREGVREWRRQQAIERIRQYGGV